mmetsp:Transcript_125152/g.359415  ORF Transcript_125152/g.359415 Transcript_125152/m.359415 type:complete len:712 (-) Transcript_125152:3-2138(-)
MSNEPMDRRGCRCLSWRRQDPNHVIIVQKASATSKDDAVNSGQGQRTTASAGEEQIQPDSEIPGTPSTAAAKSAGGDEALLAELRPANAGPPCRIEKTERRGIRLEQLVGLVGLLRRCCSEDGAISTWRGDSIHSPTRGQPIRLQSVNLYHLNERLIIPATVRWACSFVEVLARNPEAQVPEYFVSHWWGEPVVHFVSCLQAFSKARRLKNAVFWVCAYANNQHNLQAEVSDDPSQSSFRSAMALTKGTVVVLDSLATPFRRVWCSFELFTTLKDQSKTLDIATFFTDGDLLPEIIQESWPTSEGRAESRDVLHVPGGRADLVTDGIIPEDDQRKGEMVKFGHISKPALPADIKAMRESTFSLEVAFRGYDTAIETSNATVDSDRVHILNCIVGASDLDAPPPAKHPSYDKVNQTIRSRLAMAVICQAVRSGKPDGVERSFQAMCEDPDRTELRMEVPGTEFSDEMMGILAQRLPGGLQTLRLNLGGTKATDLAGMRLGEALGRLANLSSFELYVNSKEMTNAVPAALAQSWTPSSKLTSLSLTFTSLKVDDAGAATFAEGLRHLKSLTYFRVGFSYTKITGVGVSAVAQAMRSATALTDLGFTVNNTAVGSDGAIAVADAFASLPHINEIWVGFYNSKVGDDGAAAVYKAAAALSNVANFFADFRNTSVSQWPTRVNSLDELRSAVDAGEAEGKQRARGTRPGSASKGRR